MFKKIIALSLMVLGFAWINVTPASAEFCVAVVYNAPSEADKMRVVHKPWTREGLEALRRPLGYLTVRVRHEKPLGNQVETQFAGDEIVTLQLMGNGNLRVHNVSKSPASVLRFIIQADGTDERVAVLDPQLNQAYAGSGDVQLTTKPFSDGNYDNLQNNSLTKDLGVCG